MSLSGSSRTIVVEPVRVATAPGEPPPRDEAPPAAPPPTPAAAGK